MTAAIRAYDPGDLHDLLDLFRSSISQLARDHYDDKQRQAWQASSDDAQSWRERLSILQVLVAHDEHGPLGFIGYDTSGYVDLLFVAPRAARTGVATALFSHAERHLLSLGCREVSTRASDVARPFFERHGFIKDRDVTSERDGCSLHCADMSKSLV